MYNIFERLLLLAFLVATVFVPGLIMVVWLLQDPVVAVAQLVTVVSLAAADPALESLGKLHRSARATQTA